MVPDGWSEEPLGKRIDIRHGFAFSSSYFNTNGDGYRLLTPGHFFEQGGFRNIGEKQKYYSGEVPEGYLLKQGTVLVAMTEQAPGLLGSSLVVPVDGLYLHNQRLGKVVLHDPERDDQSFLFHVFNASYVRKEISAAAGGTKVRHSSPDKIKQVVVRFPPKGEQRAISHILSTWDRCIGHFADLIAAKVRFRQGLSQQLLTGTRRFERYEDEWSPVQLRDVTTECDERNRGRLGMNDVMGVTKAEGIVPMRERTIGADLARYLVVKTNRFAYNPMRINIGSIARWQGERDILVSPDYVVFQCNEANDHAPGIDPDYLDHLRRSGIWENFVTAAGNGSVRVRIYFGDLGHLKFKLPSMSEQQKIATFLNTVDREIGLLREQLEALKQQKKGLMQKLLTGQVPVRLDQLENSHA